VEQVEKHVLSQMTLCEQATRSSAQDIDSFLANGCLPGSHEVVSQSTDMNPPGPSEARKGSMVIEQERIELTRTQSEGAL
jgi:hypothetical protein